MFQGWVGNDKKDFVAKSRREREKNSHELIGDPSWKASTASVKERNRVSERERAEKRVMINYIVLPVILQRGCALHRI